MATKYFFNFVYKVNLLLAILVTLLYGEIVGDFSTSGSLFCPSEYTLQNEECCVCNLPPDCSWGYNPPAYSKCGNDCDSYLDNLGFRFDFLWWKPSAEGLALGSEEKVIFKPFTLLGQKTINHSHIKQPHFKFDPGFRLGLTYFCPCSCWDIALNWTHYHSKASVTGESKLPLFGLGQHPTIFVPFWERVIDAFPDFAKGHWTFETDLIDLEFGHKYYVASCFILRPHVGLRGGRIDQGYHVFSSANRRLNIAVGSYNRYRSKVDAKNDFSGVGPRLGVDIEIDLGCGISVIGKAAGTIFLGRTQCHAKEIFSDFVLDEGFVFFKNTIDWHVNGSRANCYRSMTDLAIGIKWDHCFCYCNQYHPVTFGILWEHHALYRFDSFSFAANSNNNTFEDDHVGKIPVLKKPGDIFLQGLTAALNIGF